MTDDMGFSDLGCFGSEIETPHLDNLAYQGIRFTQFYNAGRCCPTRASLMTGLYSHLAGVGAMTRDEGIKNPAYRGRLTENAITIAEALQMTGYNTIQTGKWHLGSRKKEWWPSARGFTHTFGVPEGGGFYFRPGEFNQYRSVRRNEEIVYDPKIDPPKGWYSTDAWTDEGLDYVKQSVEKNKPFFWYLAYNAPHWPLKAKPKDIEKYRGKYKVGWDKIREQRYQKLIELNMIPSDWNLSKRHRDVPAWESLTEKQKDEQDHIMATYAAMIDCVDQNVGKIVDELKRLNVFEDTLILFLHDNGGSPESSAIGENKGKGECGSETSFVLYGKSWANVSNTPFAEFKSDVHEGGIASPLIAHWPNGITPEVRGRRNDHPIHLIDIMPTCLEMAEIDYPSHYQKNKLTPLSGKSLIPLFNSETFDRQAPLFFEHSGSRAIREGVWKMVKSKKSDWELFHLERDRTETVDLIEQYPEKVVSLSQKYEAWAKKVNLYRTKAKK